MSFIMSFIIVCNIKLHCITFRAKNCILTSVETTSDCVTNSVETMGENCFPCLNINIYFLLLVPFIFYGMVIYKCYSEILIEAF